MRLVYAIHCSPRSRIKHSRKCLKVLIREKIRLAKYMAYTVLGSRGATAQFEGKRAIKFFFFCCNPHIREETENHQFFIIIFLNCLFSHHAQTQESVSCHNHDPGSRGGGVLRFGSDGGVPLKPANPYLSLRVILAEKGTHY